MSSGGGSAPQYTTVTASQPDPTSTANAQQTYNVNAAVAQNQLNNTNQVTPYGTITYNQTGGNYVGGTPAVAATAATGGYWNGYSWVPTGGSAGKAATQGNYVPQYTATTKLSPLVQSIVDQSLYNARGTGGLQTSLISQLKDAKYPANLDLSWGNTANKIYGLERQTLDPFWAHAQELKNQSLANQGLTPGSEGWKYEQTQLNSNRSDAYTNAMLGAQNTAANNLTAEYNAKVNQYNSQYNVLNALKSGAQISQPGVGQTAQTSSANVTAQPGTYAQTANSNYASGLNYNATIAGLQNDQYKQQQAQQNQMLSGLFGLGGNLITAISDRRDKTDIKKLGVDPTSNLPMYAYRYKDDPKTYPKVVGPMAQDVEKVYPEAVGEVGGHKVIFGLGDK